jgi:uncharacterized Zn finger protein
MDKIPLDCPSCGEKCAYIKEEDPHTLCCTLCGMAWTIERPEEKTKKDECTCHLGSAEHGHNYCLLHDGEPI